MKQLTLFEWHLALIFFLALSTSTQTVTAQATCPLGNFTLPCLPCVNGGVCNGTERYRHTDGQTFGKCNCTDTGYVGTQCERLNSVPCASPCLHGGFCAGGVCECTANYAGADCSRVRCGNLVSGLKVTPNAFGFCPGQECSAGYGDEFCMSKIDVRACQSSEIFTQTLYTTEEKRHFRCFSDDPGWQALLMGTSSVFVKCEKPAGWNGTDPNTGWCTMDFFRNASGTHAVEELFTCNFSKCVETPANLDAVRVSTSHIVQFDALNIVEPGGALALRVLLFLSAIAVASLALLGDYIPRPHLVVPIALAVVIFFLILNLSAAATNYADANKKNNVEFAKPSATDVMLALKCSESKCTCLPAVTSPNCGDTPMLKSFLEGLKSKLDFVCNDNTKDCTFAHEDLFGFNIGMKCSPRDCRGRIESTENVGKAQFAEEQKSLVAVIIVCVLAGLVVVGLLVSFIYYLVEYRALHKEWYDHLNDCQEVELSAPPHRIHPQPDSSDKTQGAAPNSQGPASGASTMVSTSIRVENVRYVVPSTAYNTTRGGRKASFTSRKRSIMGGGEKQDKVKDGKVTIIDDVNHTFYGGQMTAVMGPSGCGKTTLLDIMCGREKSGTVEGSVHIATTMNGATCPWTEVTQADQVGFRRLVSYVADDDVILPTLTVMEALQYTCALRQPVYIPQEEKQRFVQRLIHMFRLQHCQHTTIGSNAGEHGGAGGLSQGERRRTAIAMHLCALPRILVLDEPTTGLDSYNARLVIQSLRNATHVTDDTGNNKSMKSIYHGFYSHHYNYRPTVILSIHQPSMDLLEMFDSIVLMTRGKVLYAGPVHGETLERFLAEGMRFHMVKKQKVGQDAEGVSVGTSKKEDEGEDEDDRLLPNSALSSIPLPDRLLLFATVYHGPAHFFKSDADAIRRSSIVATHLTLPLTLVESQSRVLPLFWTQVKILMERGWTHLLRRSSIFSLHYLVSSVVSLMISFMYGSSDRDVPGTLAKAGAITFYLLWLSVINLSALDLLLSERATFIFERNASCYGSAAYFLTKFLLDIVILRMIPTALSGALLYFPVGLKPTIPAFGNFIGVTMLFSIATAALSILVAALAPSFGQGLLLNGFILMIFFAFGGFVSQDSLVPSWLSWIRWLSPFNLAFETILVGDLEGQLCTFAPRDPSGKPTTGVTITLQCEQFLFNLGLQPKEVLLDVSLLVIWAGLYLVLTWCALHFFVRGRR